MPEIKLRRAACPVDLEEPAQKPWSPLLAQPVPRGIGASDLAGGWGWEQLCGKVPAGGTQCGATVLPTQLL